jgi:hypothetical protein
MKFKEKENYNELYNEMRYNKNTQGNHISIEKKQSNMDKRNAGMISIFSLMTSSGYYEEAESEIIEKEGENVINRMIDNSIRKINNTFIKE